MGRGSNKQKGTKRWRRNVNGTALRMVFIVGRATLLRPFLKVLLMSRFALSTLCAVTLLLGACGGGGGDVPPPSGEDCSVSAQQLKLGNYMDDWYFWYRLSPRPASSGYATVASYFEALLYTGSDPAFPRDRFSGSESTESFNRFFGDGQSLGYGISVAGLEVAGQPNAPLFVRYVEALSPAYVQGVRRGDRVLSINGRSAAQVISANDFSGLTANQAGEVLSLQLLAGAGNTRTVNVTAAIYALSPVGGTATLNTSGGRKLGYVHIKDMIKQVSTPIDAAFAQLKAAGVQDLVLDLRYNGGGLVSVGAEVASYVVGTRGGGQTYASLLYNDKRAAVNNTTFRFSAQAASLGQSRVFVLMGERTCSASEQVINGLRGVGLDVVAIGDTSCGKPVGFLPTSTCGRTYSVVNFESVNSRNEGRYFDGFAPTCAVAEDFTAVQGGFADPLLAAAKFYADNGRCLPQPLGAAPAPARTLGAGARAARTALDEGRGMLAR